MRQKDETKEMEILLMWSMQRTLINTVQQVIFRGQDFHGFHALNSERVAV